ncbi:MAG: PLP-dependent transferase, partial [Firmicutes bacterium]|nr:PLP-dependent transferase [Bacillota bacterium]
LKFVHYAPTLGGMRTTMSHPVTSSHNTTPDDVRRAMGITPALMRISVGIENIDDLIEDFKQAFAELE